MALLGSCWFITQSILIPQGLLKWFYLSFYIHPIFLFPCQIFLWIKSLQKLLLILCSSLVKIISLVASCFSSSFKDWVFFSAFSPPTRVEPHIVNEGVEEFQISYQKLQIIPNKYQISATSLYIYCSSVVFISHGLTMHDTLSKEEKIVEVDHNQLQKRSMLELCSNGTSDLIFKNDSDDTQKDEKQDCEDLNDEGASMSSSMSSSPAVDQGLLDLNQFSSSMDVISSKIISVVAVEQEVVNEGWMIKKLEEDEGDEFLNKYTKRMRWFDVLNQERTIGISAILDEKEGGTSTLLIEGMKAVNLSSPLDMFWSKMGRKNVLKSLEIDFELVYVGQSCLSWEALHHQYRKVEALISSCSSTNCQRGTFFHKNVAAEFQQFQVLVERFVEDERCEGKRVWNYVRRRFSNKTLLQVPNVLGYIEQDKEGMIEEAINVEVVLTAIEKCIEAFWIYVKTDKKKAQWKMRGSIWSGQKPPLEDPRDLELLSNLSSKLQQKELYLKDSQVKQKGWVRKMVNHPIQEESQRKEMLFTMIDMKLVSRVLHMSLVSSSQLQWCQEKLDSIRFIEGRIVRACISGPLFPP